MMGIVGIRRYMCVCVWVYSQQQTTHLFFLNCIDEWRFSRPDIWGYIFPLVLCSLGIRAVTERYFLYFGRQRWECHKTNSCDAMCILWHWLIIAQKNYQIPAEDRVDDLCCRTALCSWVLPVSQCQWHCSERAVCHPFSDSCATAALRFLSLAPLFKVSQVWHWQEPILILCHLTRVKRSKRKTSALKHHASSV